MAKKNCNGQLIKSFYIYIY